MGEEGGRWGRGLVDIHICVGQTWRFKLRGALDEGGEGWGWGSRTRARRTRGKNLEARNVDFINGRAELNSNHCASRSVSSSLSSCTLRLRLSSQSTKYLTLYDVTDTRDVTNTTYGSVAVNMRRMVAIWHMLKVEVDSGGEPGQ